MRYLLLVAISCMLFCNSPTVRENVVAKTNDLIGDFSPLYKGNSWKYLEQFTVGAQKDSIISMIQVVDIIDSIAIMSITDTVYDLTYGSITVSKYPDTCISSNNIIESTNLNDLFTFHYVEDSLTTTINIDQNMHYYFSKTLNGLFTGEAQYINNIGAISVNKLHIGTGTIHDTYQLLELNGIKVDFSAIL